MQNRKFKRAARINRAKAFLFTLLFHVVAIGAFMNDDAYSKLASMLPETVTEWLGWEVEAEESTQKEKDLLRP
ncbi:MAG: hypothetical protein KTR30_38545 [Saprospiraceae bacterium]|nr:hypothetical protein [Saprospiraceae bacterium]